MLEEKEDSNISKKIYNLDYSQKVSFINMSSINQKKNCQL